jgi:hypothetical protein
MINWDWGCRSSVGWAVRLHRGCPGSKVGRRWNGCVGWPWGCSAGEPALSGVDHEAGALQDFQERGPDPSDCGVVDFEVHAAVTRKAERVRGSWPELEGRSRSTRVQAAGPRATAPALLTTSSTHPSYRSLMSMTWMPAAPRISVSSSSVCRRSARSMRSGEPSMSRRYSDAPVHTTPIPRGCPPHGIASIRNGRSTQTCSYAGSTGAFALPAKGHPVKTLIH